MSRTPEDKLRHALHNGIRSAEQITRLVEAFREQVRTDFEKERRDADLEVMADYARMDCGD